MEGMVDVVDLAELDDDDVDNIIQNLRLPQDIYHPEVPVTLGRVEVVTNSTNGVLHSPEVFSKPHVDAYNKEQAPLVCSALSVEKLEMTGNLVCHYTCVRPAVLKENMTFVILKDYNDHLKSVKALKKDQTVRLMRFYKEIVALYWFEAAKSFFDVFIGTQNFPLAYMLQKENLSTTIVS